MARPDKVAAVADVKDRFESSAAMLLTNYRGLTVAELQELRAELRKANATYRVSKNTLIRRALNDAGVEDLDDMLVGPTALVFCEDDPVGPAKALKAFLKDHPDLQFKGAYFDGAAMDADEALKLADLESREDLLAKLAGLMYGALANTARLLQALPEKQARLMQALVDDGGYAGAPTEAAAEPATEQEPDADESTAPAADEAVADAPEAAADAAVDDAPASDATDTAGEDAPQADQPEASAEASDEPDADAETADAGDDDATDET